MKTPPPLPARIAKYDLGGALAQLVPALNVPFIATPTPQAFDLSETITKLQKEAKEGQDKALEDSDKIWRETLKDAKLLPVDQQVISQKKDELMRVMQEKATADPYFMANPANRMMMQRMVGKVLDGAPMAQMRKRYELVGENYKALSKDKMAAPYMVEGRYSGFSNEQAFKIMQESAGTDAEKLLGYTRDNDENKTLRGIGTFNANQRYGTLNDAATEIDTASGLIKASVNAGGWEKLTPSEQMAQLVGNTGSALLKTSKDWLNSSNVGNLSSLAEALSKGWKRNLPENARQGLEDNFFTEFQRVGAWTKPIESTEGKKASASKDKPMSAALVEQLARAGKLKDSEKILAEIDQQRQAFIDTNAQNWVKLRILSRAETRSESKTGLSVASDGHNPGNESGDGYEQDYNFQHMNGALEYKATTGANALDPANPLHMMFTQPTPARQEQFSGWIGKPLSSLESGTDINLPNKYGVGFKLKSAPNLDLSQFNVIGFNGDGYIMDRAGQEFQALQARYDNTADKAERVALAKQMAQQSIAQQKTAVTRVTVAAPAKAIANAGSDVFSYLTPSIHRGGKAQRIDNPLESNLMPSGSYTDGWDVRSDNPYGMVKKHLTAEQATKYGFAEAGEYVLFDVITDFSTNNLLNDPRAKNRQAGMDQLKQQQSQQQTFSTAADANPFR